MNNESEDAAAAAAAPYRRLLHTRSKRVDKSSFGESPSLSISRLGCVSVCVDELDLVLCGACAECALLYQWLVSLSSLAQSERAKSRLQAATMLSDA